MTDTKNLWDEVAEAGERQLLEEWVGTIQDVTFMTSSQAFGVPSQFGENVVARFETTIDQAISPPDFPFATARFFLSIGKVEHWQILEGGKRLVQVGRIGSSKYQRFIRRVVKELKVPVHERGLSPFDSSAWLGLKFHFKAEYEPLPAGVREPTDEGPDTMRIILPQEWLQDRLPPLPDEASKAEEPPEGKTIPNDFVRHFVRLTAGCDVEQALAKAAQDPEISQNEEFMSWFTSEPIKALSTLSELGYLKLEGGIIREP